MQDYLRVLLGLLTNITHNNREGCEKMVEAGALAAVPLIVVHLMTGNARVKGALEGMEGLDLWLDELNLCLGLLINVVEGSEEGRQGLRDVTIGGEAGGGNSKGGTRMIPVLCQLFTTVGGKGG